jgi:C4-type Zn-finger protein
MSSFSEAVDCPNCGGKESLETSTENRPVLMVSGFCLECGYSYDTIEEQMTLDEVNEQRVEFELEPLKELKPKITEMVETPEKRGGNQCSTP